MSVRMGMLALLDQQSMYGYQLRGEFERRTGGTWPVNMGQIYTTLQRLQRDGLVVLAERHADDDNDRYLLTAAGRECVAEWWTAPVERAVATRDELAIKLALAVSAPGVDVAAVVQAQRKESLRVLRDYTRMQMSLGRGEDDGDGDGGDLAWSLVLDNLVFGLEAELRWLDHVEGRVAAASRARPARRRSAAASEADSLDGADAPPAKARR